MIRISIAAAIALGTLVSAAYAQEAEGAFVPPEWERLPHERDFRRHYPHEAFEAGLSGRVVVDCVVNLDSTLDCVVAGENPPDMGFGDAALAMSRSWRVRPATRGGVPVEGVRLRVPVAFDVR